MKYINQFGRYYKLKIHIIFKNLWNALIFSPSWACTRGWCRQSNICCYFIDINSEITEYQSVGLDIKFCISLRQVLRLYGIAVSHSLWAFTNFNNSQKHQRLRAKNSITPFTAFYYECWILVILLSTQIHAYYWLL